MKKITLLTVLFLGFFNLTIKAAPSLNLGGVSATQKVAPLPPLKTVTLTASTSNKCTSNNPDMDRDGHKCIPQGGDDCDDGDVRRYPGAPEVCDAEGHDEDCNPETFGNLDRDGDGWPDSRCCNAKGTPDEHCGNDCDDSSIAIFPGAQVCGRAGEVYICRKGRTGSELLKAQCYESGEVCHPQPNGTGVCGK